MAGTYSRNSESTQSALNLGLGLGGWDYITDTDTHDGDWVAVQALGGAAKINSLSAGNSDTITGDVSLGQDATIVGPITSIKLSSGSVIAYKRV